MKHLTYLLLFLLLNGSVNAFCQELTKEELKEITETYFCIKTDAPTRYYSNILIQIQGEPTPQDSAIIQEVVDSLNSVIATWDVHIVESSTSNLNIEINNKSPRSELFSSSRLSTNQQEIIESTLVISYDDISSTLRRKKIHYQVLRSLVQFNPSSELTKLIPGSVFAEKNPEDITFSPVDFQLLSAIYSESYDQKVVKIRNSFLFGLPQQTQKLISVLAVILAILFPMAFLLFFFQKGVFRNHNYRLGNYLSQGFLIIAAGIIFITILATVVKFVDNSTKYISILDVLLSIVTLTLVTGFIGFISLLATFYFEKLVLRKSGSLFFILGGTFVSTTFLPSIILGLLVLSFIIRGASDPIYLEGVTLLLQFVSFFLVIAIIRVLLVYISRKSEHIIHKKDVELARLNELHKQAELQSLRSKINPHFLYNSLNSIASLAKTDAHKTEQMALSLSDFFRYSINREQKQTNPISEELQAIKTYLEIEKVRFGERLNYSIICPKELCETKIPQLLVQPLVENAVKHGISNVMENGLIKIVVFDESNRLKIRVSDNGPKFPDGPLTGFGIRNTYERLSLFYGTKASIYWQNGEEKSIEIAIPL